MGISPSILSVASVKELSERSRLPPRLRNVDLSKLCEWYTIFREMGSASANPRHVAMVLEVSDSDMLLAARILQGEYTEEAGLWDDTAGPLERQISDEVDVYDVNDGFSDEEGPDTVTRERPNAVVRGKTQESLVRRGISEGRKISAPSLYGAVSRPGNAGPKKINVWELLTLLAALSDTLSLRTKLCFFFRMWDIDQDKKLHVAEVALLLRTLVYSLANYCQCDKTMIPQGKAVRKYVERTFKPMTSEDAFVKWGSRHRLLRSVLLAFTPNEVSLVELLDFVLSGPKLNKVTVKSRGRNSVIRRESTGGLQGFGEESVPSSAISISMSGPASPKTPASPKLASPKASKRSSANNFALPTVGESPDLEGEHANDSKEEVSGTLPRINQTYFAANAPANVQGQEALLGQLRLMEATASKMDVTHHCPLHKDKLECMLLSKSEVLLAHRLFMFFKENRDMEFSVVKGIIDRLRANVAVHPSTLVQTEHRYIFKLMDTNYNRIFRDIIRRIRRGLRVAFPMFLESVCPCASDARRRLYEFWHVHCHWCQEEASTRIFKRWRKDFENTKPADMILSLREDIKHSGDGRAGDHVLSIHDLIQGGVVTHESAEEVMQANDVGEDLELNENEFLEMFLGEMAEGSVFEEMLRKKFSRAAANVQKYRTFSRAVSKTASDRSTTKDHTLEELSGFTLEELLQSADLSEAFDFTDSFIEKDWSAYIPNETVRLGGARKTSGNKDVSGGLQNWPLKAGTLKVPQNHQHKRASCPEGVGILEDRNKRASC